MTRILVALLAGTLLVVGAACDSAPGLGEESQGAPTVSALMYTPESVLLDQYPAPAGEPVTVPLDIAVEATDPDRDIAHVGFVVRSPVPGADPVASGELTRSAGDSYSTSLDWLVDRGLTGAYTLVVYAYDHAGQLGNEVTGRIVVEASGSPPEITAIEGPERVAIPAPGQPAVTFAIVATVEDPDGLSNVLSVQMVVDGAATLELCDDGGVAGGCNGGNSEDAVAGDGRFTITLSINDQNTPGTRTLEFQALDRSGLSSDVVSRTLILE